MSRSRPPVFVGGTEETAATVVARLIGESSEYAYIPVRLRFHVDPGGLADVIMKRADVDDFCEQFVTRWFETGDGGPPGLERIVDRDELEAAITTFRANFDHGPAFAGRRLFSKIADPVIDRAETSSWVEMSLRNIEIGPTLARMFPDLRFVHALRDGRDVAAGLAEADWGPDDVFSSLDRWCERIAVAHERARGLDDDRYLPLHLEDLFGPDRHRAFSLLSDFLDIAWDREMRIHFQHRMSEREAGIGTWRNHLSEDEHDGFLEAYRKALTDLDEAGVPWYRHRSEI